MVNQEQRMTSLIAMMMTFYLRKGDNIMTTHENIILLIFLLCWSCFALSLFLSNVQDMIYRRKADKRDTAYHLKRMEEMNK